MTTAVAEKPAKAAKSGADEKPVREKPDAEKFKKLNFEIKELARNIEREYTEIAEKLATMKDEFEKVSPQDAKKAYGYDTFDMWWEKELGWAQRKVDYFVSIYKDLHEKAGLSKEEIAKVDWSKARELTSLVKKGKMDKDNAKKWLAEAKKSTFEEIQHKVKKALGRGKSASGEGVESIEAFKVGLYPSQMKTVQRALDVAKKAAKSEKLGYCLDLICTEFLASHTSKDDRDAYLRKLRASVEGSFKGIKIVVIDTAKQNAVIAGKDNVKALKE